MNLTQDEVAERFGCVPALLKLLAIASAAAVVLAALLGTWFLVALRDWDFEGSDGLRYWLLIKGTRLGQLGLVAPTARPAHYRLRFQDGTAPGLDVVTYDSSALPSAVIAAYAERCEAMGLRVTKRQPWYGSDDTDAPEATLECQIGEIDRGGYRDTQLDTAKFHAVRKAPGTATTVSVEVTWW
jgi:hypothetical protein